VEPGSQVNAPAQISIFPSVEGVTYRNLAKTSYEEDDLRVSRHWMTKENLIEIEGVIGLNSSAVLHEIPLESPSMYAALLLRDYLAKQGIQVTGKIRYQKTPEDARCLVTHSSAPVSELIYPVMKKSDNLYSNCLFKKMGEQLTGDAGSWQNGAKTVRKFLCDKAEIDIDDLVLVDGDGESRYNLVSPHLFISFLTWMQEKFLFFPEFQASMLISGVDGKLSRRLQDPEMKGKVRAKGGRMTGISGLVGYALSKDGETLAFAILVNGFIKPAEEYENLEDQICKLLTQFSRE
jgi:D-alanyl-D-alanine carboxypeptidase/D-alanyl-D-alanine-endopeptidase (penicillin-binding protein 4)